MVTLPIALSSGFVPIVKINDSVKVGQVIAKKTPSVERIINLSTELSVPKDQAGKYLRKNPGEMVMAGDILAVRKSRFGLTEKKLISRMEGVMSRYERDSGNLILVSKTAAGNYIDIVSPVDGIVLMCDNDKIVLGTERQVYSCLKVTGGSVFGEVYVLEEPRDNALSLFYALDRRAVGKIIVGRDFPRDILIKSIGIGALGIVGTNIRDEDIDYLAQRHSKIPIFEVDNNTIEEVIRWKGKIYLNSQEKVILFLHA